MGGALRNLFFGELLQGSASGRFPAVRGLFFLVSHFFYYVIKWRNMPFLGYLYERFVFFEMSHVSAFFKIAVF